MKDTRTLVYLFLALRVMLLMVYQPELLAGDTVERGLTTLGDFREHYGFASQISADNLPYKDYWVEFPPVWIGLAALLAQLVTNFTAWANLMFLLMLAVDLGNLLLIRRLGERLHDEETGFTLAWIYALLAAPIVMLAWNFEVLVLFTMLGGFLTSPLTPLHTGKGEASVGVQHVAPLHWQSVMLVALGILTKYIPVLLLPTVWRFAPRRTAIFYTVGVIILCVGVLLPLILWGGEMAVKSLTVQFDKPSYQTVWALLDGNYGTGSFGTDRYDVTYQPNAAPLLPNWIRLIPFALLGWWIFRLPMSPTLQNQWAFFSLTVLLFMLWSQGWSPQWTVLVMPLILLNFPSRVGVLLCLALMAGAFMEYPVLFRQTADTGNLISGGNRVLFSLLVLTRTVLLAGISAILIAKLHQQGAS